MTYEEYVQKCIHDGQTLFPSLAIPARGKFNCYAAVINIFSDPIKDFRFCHNPGFLYYKDTRNCLYSKEGILDGVYMDCTKKMQWNMTKSYLKEEIDPDIGYKIAIFYAKPKEFREGIYRSHFARFDPIRNLWIHKPGANDTEECKSLQEIYDAYPEYNLLDFYALLKRPELFIL